MRSQQVDSYKGKNRVVWRLNLLGLPGIEKTLSVYRLIEETREGEGRMEAIFIQNCGSWDERNCPSEDLRSLYEKK